MREEQIKYRPFAKQLRANMTEAEKALWYHLRAKRFLGVRFYRQKIIGRYIVDFVSLEAKLVIELDGSQHLDNVEYDESRTYYLETQGFQVIRFWNQEILTNMRNVLDIIALHIANSPPSAFGTFPRKRGKGISWGKKGNK